MGVLVACAIALCIWVAMWGLGAKAIDAIMVALLIALTAAAVRIFSPYLPGNRQRDE